jgi:ethanolamine ammonia-lyase small subunit
MLDLRRLTPARVALGRAGASLPTQALLDFTLAHARARDAVHAAFDADGIEAALQAQGLATLRVFSKADTRKTYLGRPDLGRTLADASRERLAAADRLAGPGDAGCDLVIVIADGLSPLAVSAQAAAVLRALLPRLQAARIGVGAAVVAEGARVALGDEIGAALNARMLLMLIGERPGLSAPHSLGAYLTYAPKHGLTDADRNCVSNVHPEGITPDEAAFKIAWLVREAFARQRTGVSLKDDSGVAASLAAPRPE